MGEHERHRTEHNAPHMEGEHSRHEGYGEHHLEGHGKEHRKEHNAPHMEGPHEMHGKRDANSQVNHSTNEGTRIGHGEHHRIAGERSAYKFPANKKEADCFCGTSKSGLYRVSGKSGAHQIGKK